MGLLQAEKPFWKHNSRATRYSETGRIRALLRSSSNRIQVVDEMPADGAPAVFYDRVVSDRRGLPYSEGVVVKDNHDPTGTTWFKVKARPDFDWEIAPDGIVPGSGKYAGSAGAIRVQHPETGARSELGSLAISDAERLWIWQHRTELEGHAVAKFEAMEITEAGAVRAGIFTGLHQTKGSEDVLQLIGSHTTQVRDAKGGPYRSYIPGSDRSTVCVPCCS